MRSNTKLVRDPFTFSLRGVRAVNSHSPMPVMADNGINRAWDTRLRRLPRADRAPATRQIETVLARYFAPGCCDAR